MSILVTVILLLFGFTLIQTLVSDLVGIEPWFVLTYGSGIIGNILNSPYPLPKSRQLRRSVLVHLLLLHSPHQFLKDSPS